MPDEVISPEEQAAMGTPLVADPAPAPEPAAPAEPAPTAPVEPAAAPVAAEPAPAAPAEPAATPAPKPDEPHMVPYGALREERERRQAAERQAAERQAKLEGRLEEIARRLAAPEPAPQAPAPLDIDADPVAALKAVKQQVDQFAALTAEQRTAAERQQQQHQQFQEFHSKYVKAAADFKATNTDFDQAYQHFIASRDSALQAAGFTDPAHRAAILANEERTIAEKAFAEGDNPASRLYAVSKSFGYKRSEPAPAAAAASPAPAGAASQPAAPAPTPTEAQKLAAVSAGVARGSQSIGAAGGAPPPKLSLETIATMSDEDFGRAINDADFKKMMRAHYAQAS